MNEIWEQFILGIGVLLVLPVLLFIYEMMPSMDIDWRLTLDGMLQLVPALIALMIVIVYEVKPPKFKHELEVQRKTNGDKVLLIHITATSLRPLTSADMDIVVLIDRSVINSSAEGVTFDEFPGRAYIQRDINLASFRLGKGRTLTMRLHGGKPIGERLENSILIKTYIWGELESCEDVTKQLR